MATDDSAYKAFVDSTLREFLTREDYQSSALSYLLYEKHPYKNPFSFKTLKAYNQYIQDNELRTFQKELVKSYEELLIANFLFQNGINYQYEANSTRHEALEGIYQAFWLMPLMTLTDHKLFGGI